MTSFLSLLYKGEAKQVSDDAIDEVNQVCHLLGVDLQAIKLNKAAPKESSARKKRVLLGGDKIFIEKEKKVVAAAAASLPPQEKVEDKKEPVATIKKSTRPKQLKAAASNVKYCLCREPERPGMIGCDFCEEWYHIACLNLTKDDAMQLTKRKWKCPKCELSDSKQAKGMARLRNKLHVIKCSV